jgi:hypothetical protein
MGLQEIPGWILNIAGPFPKIIVNTFFKNQDTIFLGLPGPGLSGITSLLEGNAF